mgnify:CR=1 FL=1
MSCTAVMSKSSWLVLVGLGLSACATPPEQDPTYQKLIEVDGRVLRIEKVINNQSLLDLSQKDDALQNELRVLRGQLEELQNSLDKSRIQSQDIYAEVDKRIQVLESSKVAAVTQAPAISAPNTMLSDNDAYQVAFGLLKEFKYAEAASAFAQFIANYPNSKLLDNAQYWLGESHYGLKDYSKALSDFEIVIKKFANSSKQPDALLKSGYSQYELKLYKDARNTLQQVLKLYPDSNAAKLAQQRLTKIAAEGY